MPSVQSSGVHIQSGMPKFNMSYECEQESQTNAMYKYVKFTSPFKYCNEHGILQVEINFDGNNVPYVVKANDDNGNTLNGTISKYYNNSICPIFRLTFINGQIHELYIGECANDTAQSTVSVQRRLLHYINPAFKYNF